MTKSDEFYKKEQMITNQVEQALAGKIAYQEVLKRTGKGDAFVPVSYTPISIYKNGDQNENFTPKNYWLVIFATPGPGGYQQEPIIKVTVDIKNKRIVDFNYVDVK